MSGGSHISVVVPVYNAEHTIRDAIASIDAQATSELDVIVVDDVSTDATRDILKNEVSNRQGYRIIERQKNGGPAAARNDGIGAASGDWIAFLDGDDAWLPRKLETQLALAAQHPDVDLWCAATVRLGVDATEGADMNEPGADPAHRAITLEEFVKHNPVATSTVLVKREALEACGGFDDSFVGPEDYDLWMRMAVGHRLALIDSPLSQYRHVVGSLSMDDRKFLPQVLRVLDKGFAEGGALCDYRHQRQSAISNQLWNASWMAFNRGARVTAIRYWIRSWWMNLRADQRESRKWGRLLFRYLFGRPA
jgi:glycosyltransferase involved in cell wall biosynthesis